MLLRVLSKSSLFSLCFYHHPFNSYSTWQSNYWNIHNNNSQHFMGMRRTLAEVGKCAKIFMVLSFKILYHYNPYNKFYRPTAWWPAWKAKSVKLKVTTRRIQTLNTICLRSLLEWLLLRLAAGLSGGINPLYLIGIQQIS